MVVIEIIVVVILMIIMKTIGTTIKITKIEGGGRGEASLRTALPQDRPPSGPPLPGRFWPNRLWPILVFLCFGLIFNPKSPNPTQTLRAQP